MQQLSFPVRRAIYGTVVNSCKIIKSWGRPRGFLRRDVMTESTAYELMHCGILDKRNHCLLTKITVYFLHCELSDFGTYKVIAKQPCF
jgi:hypothetical protein